MSKKNKKKNITIYKSKQADVPGNPFSAIYFNQLPNKINKIGNPDNPKININININ